MEETPLESQSPIVEPLPLVVDSLSKRYDGTRALDELSFEVRPGEILGLVGPNGAGKTTALRLVAGVLPIREGSVRICGHDVVREDVQAKRCLGWVPDDPEPFDTLTVMEHLEFTASLHGARNFPLRKQRSDLDIEMADGTRDLEYLELLDHALHQSLQRSRPDLVFVQAGVDALDTDALGRMALSPAGMRERDHLVLGELHRLGLPTVLTLGGGYSRPLEATIEAHVGTYEVLGALRGG